MFRPPKKQNMLAKFGATCALTFHLAVRTIRRSHGNAALGLAVNIFQSMVMVLVFYGFTLISSRFGASLNRIRGDFLLYMMSGVFMFMTHAKALGSVVGSEGPSSPMMKHQPMNSLISIGGGALSALYLQFISAAIILIMYHVIFNPITIHDPAGAIGMFLLAWGSGVALGMVIRAMLPWQPEFFGVTAQLYQRANIVASGKMLLANALPTFILAWFVWNPLFHIIDRGRGYIFANYHPRYSSVEYPLIFTAACVVIGLMGEFYTRRHASLSWSAKH